MNSNSDPLIGCRLPFKYSIREGISTYNDWISQDQFLPAWGVDICPKTFPLFCCDQDSMQFFMAPECTLSTVKQGMQLGERQTANLTVLNTN